MSRAASAPLISFLDSSLRLESRNNDLRGQLPIVVGKRCWLLVPIKTLHEIVAPFSRRCIYGRRGGTLGILPRSFVGSAPGTSSQAVVRWPPPEVAPLLGMPKPRTSKRQQARRGFCGCDLGMTAQTRHVALRHFFDRPPILLHSATGQWITGFTQWVLG